MSQLPDKYLQPKPSTLTKFHLFASLPLELRQYIWALSLPGPRIHRIVRTSLDRPGRSSCLPPNIMLVCREARNEALRHLKRLNLPSLLPGNSHTISPIWRPAPQCFFNPAMDTVFLPRRAHIALRLWGPDWLNGSDGTDFSLIRHLALDVSWVLSPQYVDMPLGEIVRRMGHVEVLHLISINGYWSNRITCGWHDFERPDWKKRSEFTWVDTDEVKRRPGGWRPAIFPEWGEWSATARAGPDVLSSEKTEAMARYKDVMGLLESERMRWPDGWTFPKVQLDFVRCDMVEKKIPVWARSGRLSGPASAKSLWSKPKLMAKLRKLLDRGKASRNRFQPTVTAGIRNVELGFKRFVNLQGWVDLLFKSTWLARAEQRRFTSRAIREMAGNQEITPGHSFDAAGRNADLTRESSYSLEPGADSGHP